MVADNIARDGVANLPTRRIPKQRNGQLHAVQRVAVCKPHHGYDYWRVVDASLAVLRWSGFSVGASRCRHQLGLERWPWTGCDKHLMTLVSLIHSYAFLDKTVLHLFLLVFPQI